ncbi:MAG TPA: hypothetical protein VGG65_07270 [Thermoanaerobaculia bacterium]
MRPDEPDRDLAPLFEAERRADETAAPDMDALLGRPRIRRTRTSVPVRRLILASLAAGVIAALLLLRRPAAPDVRRETEAAAQTATSLAEWHSPTGFLLQTPGSDLLTRIPTLAPRSTILGNGAHPSPTKGVDR